jgi:hypothetical protein
VSLKDERILAMTDHMYLGCEVLGMDFQEIPHRGLFDLFIAKDATFGTPLNDLATMIKKRMILWPRGTLKTSATVVDQVQTILCYPNVRICHMTGGDSLAKEHLARVKSIFEQPTDKFLDLFPEFCGRRLGNAHRFTVPARKRSMTAFAQPTFKISTAKSVKASTHYDVIYIDDLVNETNYRSPKLLEKSINDYKDIIPLLEPEGYMYVTGTRYSFGDLYQEIQEQAEKEMKETGRRRWSFSVLPCWVRYCRNCEHWCSRRDVDHNFDLNASEPTCMKCKCKGWEDTGVKDVLFPKAKCKDGRSIGHTIEFLELQKSEMGSEFFANQYENNPIAAGEQTFTPELIAKQTLFHSSQFPTALQAPAFFVGDLSYVGADDRDKSVFYVVRQWQGQLFVIDCLSGKWDATQLCENLLLGIMKYRPVMIWIERFLGWEAYDTVIRAFARDKNVQQFPVEWMPMSYMPKAKIVRIGAVKTPLTERRLWLNAGMPEYETLCDGLKKWPKLGRHCDFQDCLGLVCAAPTGYHLDSLPKAMDTSTNWLRKLNPSAEETSVYDTRISGSF